MKRILFMWLNRRNQRQGFTWTGFQAVLDFFGVEGSQITKQHRPVQLRLL